jgi:hypothetical protein
LKEESSRADLSLVEEDISEDVDIDSKNISKSTKRNHLQLSRSRLSFAEEDTLKPGESTRLLESSEEESLEESPEEFLSQEEITIEFL